jgi:hypothetical protein
VPLWARVAHTALFPVGGRTRPPTHGFHPFSPLRAGRAQSRLDQEAGQLTALLWRGAVACPWRCNERLWNRAASDGGSDGSGGRGWSCGWSRCGNGGWREVAMRVRVPRDVVALDVAAVRHA